QPVALVQVVTRLDLVVHPPQLLAKLGLAFHTHRQRLPLQLSERAHLPAHLEDRGLGAKRERLFGARQLQTESAQLRRSHMRSRTTTGISRSVLVAYSSYCGQPSFISSHRRSRSSPSATRARARNFSLLICTPTSGSLTRFL